MWRRDNVRVAVVVGMSLPIIIGAVVAVASEIVEGVWATETAVAVWAIETVEAVWAIEGVWVDEVVVTGIVIGIVEEEDQGTLEAPWAEDLEMFEDPWAEADQAMFEAPWAEAWAAPPTCKEEAGE